MVAQALPAPGRVADRPGGVSPVRPGIQTLTRLLARRGDGTRGLYVAPRCVHTIAEYGMYQYPPDPGAGIGGYGSQAPLPVGEGFGRGPLSELPMKQNDHALDASRYALHTALGQSRATDAWMELYLRQRR